MPEQESDRGAPDSGLDVSVIIATRNRATLLDTTLRHLGAQEVGDLTWEVIVVDNGSTDDTSSVLDDHSESLPLVRVDHPEPGKNRALNRGLAVARGDLLVFTDDDVAAPSGWLTALTEAADRWPDDNIFGGPVVPRFPPGTADWMARPDFEHTRWAFSGYHPREREGPTWQTPLGPNMAIRRKAMPGAAYDESIGPSGSDYVMGSEVELLLRMYRGGDQFIFVPAAPVEHILTKGHVTFENVRRRARRFGRSEARLASSPATYPVLAVAPYRWSRLASAVARWARTRVEDEGPRRIAELELTAAWATVQEQFTMWRERRRDGLGPPPRLFPATTSVVDLLRRRGIFGLAFAAVRKLASPLVRVCTVHLYDADPRAEASVEPTTPASDSGLDIVLCHGASDTGLARSLICPMEIMTPEEIEARLEAGDSVAIGSVDGAAIGYAWACFDDHHVAGIEQTLAVGDADVCAYDGFVRADHRGRGVLPRLDRVQMALAAQLGRRRQLTYALRENRASRRSMARMGKRPLLRVRSIEMPLLRRTLLRSSDPSTFRALFKPGADGS